MTKAWFPEHNPLPSNRTEKDPNRASRWVKSYSGNKLVQAQLRLGES